MEGGPWSSRWAGSEGREKGGDWLPEGSKEPYRDRYQAWITGIKQCRDELIKQGYECEIPAIFWHCGENDRALTGMAKEYTGRFQRVMEATRRDLDLPELPWILTEQPMIPASISGEQKLYDINADLEALAAKDPHLHFVKTADLPHRPVLFGTGGILALGERMAESWEGRIEGQASGAIHLSPAFIRRSASTTSCA